MNLETAGSPPHLHQKKPQLVCGFSFEYLASFKPAKKFIILFIKINYSLTGPTP
jgi:hypothetical protein